MKIAETSIARPVFASMMPSISRQFTLKRHDIPLEASSFSEYGRSPSHIPLIRRRSVARVSSLFTMAII